MESILGPAINRPHHETSVPAQLPEREALDIRAKLAIIVRVLPEVGFHEITRGGLERICAEPAVPSHI